MCKQEILTEIPKSQCIINPIDGGLNFQLKVFLCRKLKTIMPRNQKTTKPLLELNIFYLKKTLKSKYRQRVCGLETLLRSDLQNGVHVSFQDLIFQWKIYFQQGKVFFVLKIRPKNATQTILAPLSLSPAVYYCYFSGESLL